MTNLRVAIQMDPLESINPQRDSTLRLGREAQKRGHALWHYTPDKLSLRDGRITAHAQPVTFYEDEAHYFDLAAPEVLDLSSMDVVLLRQDPPFNMQYISTTYLLERLLPETFVTNHPSSVRNLPEKLLPTLFKEFMPPTLISADGNAIEAFYAEHKDIVLKPLYGYAGHSVSRLERNAPQARQTIETLLSQGKEPWVVQTFLPEVATGDRRIILIDGEIGGIMGRIPAEGEIRANFRVGGTAVKADLTPRQRQICEALRPVLKETGLLFAGIDVIGDWLTEINITCPTGIPAMNRLYGFTLEADIWDAIERKV